MCFLFCVWQRVYNGSLELLLDFFLQYYSDELIKRNTCSACDDAVELQCMIPARPSISQRVGWVQTNKASKYIQSKDVCQMNVSSRTQRFLHIIHSRTAWRNTNTDSFIVSSGSSFSYTKSSVRLHRPELWFRMSNLHFPFFFLVCFLGGFFVYLFVWGCWVFFLLGGVGRVGDFFGAD